MADVEYDYNSYLTRIATDEGQITVTGNGASYEVQYYLRDHLGNVRMVMSEAGTIVQETEYFPFGLAIPRSGTDAVNKCQFLNREKQPETGWMDLMKRSYDPTIGRFLQVDPVTESQEDYSVYQYGWNNPILRSDPNGDCPGCDDGFLIGKLVKIAFFDVKHSIENTILRLAGSDKRADYKVENEHQVFETEIKSKPIDSSPGGIAKEAVSTVADLAVVASAGTGSGEAASLLAKTGAGNQVVKGVKEGVEAAVHANSKASDKVNTLYRFETIAGEYLKTGVTSKAIPEKRYTNWFMQDKVMIQLVTGSRVDMLKRKRSIVEANPGSLNKEPWAGKKK